MQRSEKCSQLFTALCKAQMEFTPVIKDGSASIGTGGKRKYATLNAILQMALPILGKHDIILTQNVENAPDDNSRVMITTTLAYKDDEWIQSAFTLPSDRQGGIQGLGSAITYARRYSLSALLGISLDDDDDGEAAMKGYRQPPPPAQPQQDKLSSRRSEMGKMLVASGMSKEAMPQKISEIIGRQIKSSYDLSLSEIETVIKTLTNKE